MTPAHFSLSTFHTQQMSTRSGFSLFPQSFLISAPNRHPLPPPSPLHTPLVKSLFELWKIIYWHWRRFPPSQSLCLLWPFFREGKIRVHCQCKLTVLAESNQPLLKSAFVLYTQLTSNWSGEGGKRLETRLQNRKRIIILINCTQRLSNWYSKDWKCWQKKGCTNLGQSSELLTMEINQKENKNVGLNTNISVIKRVEHSKLGRQVELYQMLFISILKKWCHAHKSLKCIY